MFKYSLRYIALLMTIFSAYALSIVQTFNIYIRQITERIDYIVKSYNYYNDLISGACIIYKSNAQIYATLSIFP